MSSGSQNSDLGVQKALDSGSRSATLVVPVPKYTAFWCRTLWDCEDLAVRTQPRGRPASWQPTVRSLGKREADSVQNPGYVQLRCLFFSFVSFFKISVALLCQFSTATGDIWKIQLTSLYAIYNG